MTTTRAQAATAGGGAGGGCARRTSATRAMSSPVSTTHGTAGRRREATRGGAEVRNGVATRRGAEVRSGVAIRRGAEVRGCRSRTNARSRQLVRRRIDRLAGMTTDAAAPILHLRGPILLGPEEELAEAWVVGGVIRHERPELPR